jgi:hypothetical protein
MVAISEKFVSPDQPMDVKVAQLLDVCKELLPDWGPVNLEDVEVRGYLLFLAC